MPGSDSQTADYMRDYRETNKDYAIRNNLMGRARAKALTRLSELYPIDFAVFCKEERLRLGVWP
jgi:hypothetical protein